MVADFGVTNGSSSWLRLARRAKFLAALTLIWLAIEGVVGVIAGVLAGSIALIAFGFDSAIEGLASIIVIGASLEPGRFLPMPSAEMGGD